MAEAEAKKKNINLTVNPIVEVAITKAKKTLEVNLENIPQKGLEYIIQYGLKQCLNDAHSQVKAGDTDNAMKAAKAKLAKIIAGTVEPGGATFGTTKLDPTFKEARTIVLGALAKAGVKPIGKIPDEATLAKVMAKYKIPVAKVMAKAKKIVKDRADGEITVEV